MGENILVTTEYLRKKEEEWKELSGQAQRAFQEAADSVKGLEQHFLGKPVREIKKKYLAAEEEGAEAFRALTAHLEKLGEMASVYEEAERSNTYVRTEN